jgi:type IV secretion system protein TrbI
MEYRSDPCASASDDLGAGETAGSTASGQFGGAGQQMMEHGMDRPPTIEIRPGYEFNVMVTEDLVFPGPYKS